MTIQALLETCLAMPAAYADTPFGPEPICAKVGKHIFAEVYPGRAWVTFRCEPEQGLMWRAQFPQCVGRGYHCPPAHQPYSYTLLLDGSVPDEVLMQMLQASYDRALKTMTRAQRKSVEKAK